MLSSLTSVRQYAAIVLGSYRRSKTDHNKLCFDVLALRQKQVLNA
jgi:hypothetical protein